jgi:Leucine-rich repeat (LRR) protein
LSDIAPKTIELSFSHVGLEIIDGNAFENLPILKILILSKNSISKLENENFKFLSSLEILDLSENQISKIDQYAFENLSKLTELNLSKNKILHFETLTFRKLFELKILRLSHNSINELRFELFTTNLQIEYLLVDFNAIKSFDVNIVERFKDAKKIDLSGNDCINVEYPKNVKFEMLKNLVLRGCNPRRFVSDEIETEP